MHVCCVSGSIMNKKKKNIFEQLKGMKGISGPQLHAAKGLEHSLTRVLLYIKLM